MAHRVASRAADDLDDIWNFVAIESRSIDVANRLIVFLLSRHPYLGRSRGDDFGPHSRSFPVGEYLIVYCVEDKDVLILRVAHGRRDIEALFDH